MTEKGTLIVRQNDDESIQQQNPLSSLFSKFTQVLSNFRLPQFPPAKKDSVTVETQKKAVVRDGEVVAVSKSATVTYPDGRSKTVGSLKLESEDMEKDTNPAVLWQVYAIGGILILKWAWGQWNERRDRKKPSNEDPPSSAPTNEDN
uniref:uncharacterized protein LOC122604068 n=1 Tax=Erigeron canadensis TaxID=72917 RepID=UPI001CB95CD2|nr:uncharacterized protein LOC122604068 [Erigeron canadensis]